MLGSLFLSKFNQVAQGRQSLAKQERHPYYIYLDEFQNFITPSITRILSGARKYGLGLVLAHQELAQIDDTKTLNSVISNPYIRICFRLGDVDAKRLESGFSYFEQNDLQSLGIGQAIMRVGSSGDDFNISTFPLSEAEINAEVNRDSIVANTRNNYSKPKAELDDLLASLLPKQQLKSKKESIKDKITDSKVIEPTEEIQTTPVVIDEPETEENQSTSSLEAEKERILRKEEEREQESKHKAIANYVITLGQQRNFITHKEFSTNEGGRIDVVLKRDDLSIAVEISVTNTIDYELQNLQKCLDENLSLIHI